MASAETVLTGTKHCTRCGEKPIGEFYKVTRNRDGLNARCKACIRGEALRIDREKKEGTFVSRRRQPRLTDSERQERRVAMLVYQRRYHAEHADRLRIQNRAATRRARDEGIVAYGGCCSCCGEAQHEFLTFEHLNGRADEPRRITGQSAWQRLRARGYPQDGYTVLCFNCNCAKGIYGTCPHQVAIVPA